ncbi:MAG: GAF domain-containing protein [Vicinamibacterales bacterium]
MICQCSAGDSHNLLPGLVIRLGERVSGWCAANQKTVMNSDAYLDLVQMASRFTPPLRSTICTPLLQDGRLSGVFTGYSSQDTPFDERHRYAVERVAELLDARLTSIGQSISKIRTFPKTAHH